MTEDEKVSGSRLLKAVESIAISPAEAKKTVQKYLGQSQKQFPKDTEQQHQDRVADKIIKRYARYAGMVGGTTALSGIIPGIGTAIAVSGGAATDATFCMKLQVDMCMCLAETYNYNLENEDARHLSFLIAGGGTLEKLGATAGVRIASQAGVRMLRMYLKGATLMAIREIFKKVGITFTRKALEKALPFGVGVAIGTGSNYALTRFVGNQAKTWFILDRSKPKRAKSKTKRKVKDSQAAA
jgi:hypothetical protein